MSPNRLMSQSMRAGFFSVSFSKLSASSLVNDDVCRHIIKQYSQHFQPFWAEVSETYSAATKAMQTRSLTCVEDRRLKDLASEITRLYDNPRQEEELRPLLDKLCSMGKGLEDVPQPRTSVFQ